jgi:hypothetical protein
MSTMPMVRTALRVGAQLPLKPGVAREVVTILMSIYKPPVVSESPFDSSCR